MTRPGAIVVGGGLAGIAAALDLSAAGTDVTLLEVRPRLGGAAYSVERDGLELDNGQHVFLRCCTEYRALLRRLGSESSTVLQPRLDIPVVAPGGRRARLRRVALPAPLQLAPALVRYRFLSPRQRVRAARTAIALARLDRDDPSLDRQAFGDWLRAHGESAASAAALWDLIALPTLNVRADEASLALAAIVFQVGLLSSASAGDVGYARVPLSRIHDGPARRALAAAGVDVRLRQRALRVEPSGEGGLAVETESDRLEADTVIVAVPHDRAADILPSAALPDRARLKQLGRSPIVNAHVVYDRPVMDVPFAAGVATPVQYVFDRTSSSGLPSGQHLAISLSGAEREMRMPPDELRAVIAGELARLFPAARGARIERFDMSREHAATFRALPGVAALRPPARTALEGLFLAGAWTATGWPATMEGAVRSGRAAAALALERRSASEAPLAATS